MSIEQQSGQAEQVSDHEMGQIVSRLENLAKPLDKSEPDLSTKLGALALGVKPAVLMSKPLDPSIRMNLDADFQRLGITTSINDQLLINPEAITKRAEQEPELAQLVGWNTSHSIDENLRGSVDGTRVIDKKR